MDDRYPCCIKVLPGSKSANVSVAIILLRIINVIENLIDSSFFWVWLAFISPSTVFCSLLAVCVKIIVHSFVVLRSLI